MPITIDEYSLAPKPIEMRFRKKTVSRGTAFIWRLEARAFLVTNWHNVTGINPRTGKHLSPTCVEPDSIVAQVDLVGSTPGTRGPVELPLRNMDGAPLWLEHPMGRRLDVVALPLPNLPSAVLYPINDMQWAPMHVSVGIDAFILGYPFGISVSTLPIWKRASIASEPGIAINGQPYFFVDTASREGMSGSPVILRSWDGFNTEDGGHTTIIGVPGLYPSRFIGVYSGRIGAQDNLQAQLGIVWRESVVDEIVSKGRLGSMVP
jgi:hypothetical protein